MGTLFTLDEATRSVISDALDDIITEFGKDCRLVHPPRWVSCENCSAEAAGKKSANVWSTGGRIPFGAGAVCPLCNGQGGHHTQEQSQSIKMKVEWDPARFWRPVPGAELRAPHSLCQTKCFVSDYPRLKAADHLVIQLPIEPYVRTKFHLVGEPISPGSIVQDRYLIADWESRG